jgi:hypothetical protein
MQSIIKILIAIIALIALIYTCYLLWPIIAATIAIACLLELSNRLKEKG